MRQLKSSLGFFLELNFGNNTIVVVNLPGAVTISEERKVCTGSEKFIKMCDSNEVRGHVEVSWSCISTDTDSEDNLVGSLCLQLDLTFHLFVCALAGAGAAVIAMVRSTHSRRQYLNTPRSDRSDNIITVHLI